MCVSPSLIRMKSWLFGVVCIALVFASGCGSQPEGPIGDGLSIVVIPKGTTHEFWKSIHAGAVKAEQELEAAGQQVKIIWKGPLKEDDRDEQIKVVENFIARGVNGMVLAPLDDKALVRPVETAGNADIPVVIIDSGLQSESFASFVATDNYYGGVLGARTLAKAIDGSGEAILLRYTVGQESAAQREQGFLDTMAKEFPDIRILSEDQYSGPTEEDAYNKSMDMLNQYGDEVDAFFVICNRTATGLLQALEDEELVGKVKLIGFDKTPHLVQAVRDGKVEALVLQDPYRMGYLGVKTLLAHLQGESAEGRIDTGVYVATRDTLDEPEISRVIGGREP